MSAVLGRKRLAVALAIAGAVLATAVPPAYGATTAEQLARLKSEVAKAGRAYDKAYWKLDESEVRLARLDREIETTDEQLEEARGRLSDRVGIMYRRSVGLGYIDVVLGSDSWEDMLTRLDFVHRLGRADAVAVAEVEGLQARLAQQRADLAKESKTREKALSGLRRERDRLRKQLEAKQAEYERLRKAAQGPTYSGGAPRGSLGMVFPVRGVCYYADTWGASRGGGRRRHKGTDIMAARGTPVVAVLSGMVTSKSGGIGGKTIWLRADNGWSFYYAHLDGWAVRSGRVSRGQVIGYVGDTGNASGGAPHLHFEMHPGGGGAVNPYPYLRACE